MLNLLNSRVSFPGNFRRSGLPSFHCSSRIGVTEVNSINVVGTAKESTALLVPSNISESCSSSPDSVEPVVFNTTVNTTVGKSKKVKSKSKKPVDSVDTTEQPSKVSLDSGVNVGKKSKRASQAIRSEDVVGHCGHFPVDDLVEFIDTGRKLNRERSKCEDEDEDEHQLAVGLKFHGLKKRSTASAKYATVENDSGFGDLECGDRSDTGIIDGLLSPSSSSGNESTEVKAEVLYSSGSENLAQVVKECSVSPVEDVQSTTNSTSFQWNNELMLDFYDNEMRVEGEFVVVQQKKRRAKAAQSVSACNNKPRVQARQFPRPRNGFSRSAHVGRHHTRPGSSTGNSTRSPSPSSVVNPDQSDHIYELQSTINVGGSVEPGSLTVIAHCPSSDERLKRSQPNLVLNSSETAISSHFPKSLTGSSIESRLRPVIKGQHHTSSVSSVEVLPNTSCNEGCVKTSDVGTMTLPDVVPDVERPVICAKSNSSSSTVVFLDNTVEQLSQRRSLGSADIVFGFDPAETSDSCRSTSADVSRTQSPCSSCDEKNLPEFSVLPQVFDMNAAQLFLHTAYLNVLQMKKTHPHSVRFYQPDEADDNAV